MPFIIKTKDLFNKGQAQLVSCSILTNLVGLNLNYCWYELWPFLVLTAAHYLVLNFLAAPIHVTYFAYAIHISITALVNLLVS